MNSLTLEARAKINLYLDITGRRENGYHELETVMQTVSLSDIVEVVRTSRGISVFCDDATLPRDRTNLAYRAAELFFGHTGISGGADIHIEKRIPVASGLAGGSADAAAVLRALSELYGEPISNDELLVPAAKLGADVPFCLLGGTALCHGIGELMTPLASAQQYTVVIARGGESVSTPYAYSLIDELGGKLAHPAGTSLSRLTSALASGDIRSISAECFNCFEQVILPVHETAAEYKKVMLAEGALAAIISGSGPAVFGIFDDTQKADCAHHRLYADGAKSFVCTAG